MSEGIIEDIRIVNRRVKSFENADRVNERLEKRGAIGNEKNSREEFSHSIETLNFFLSKASSSISLRFFVL